MSAKICHEGVSRAERGGSGRKETYRGGREREREVVTELEVVHPRLVVVAELVENLVEHRVC